MLEEMTSRIEQGSGRASADPEDGWYAGERRGQPVGGRLALPGGGARLLAAALIALAVLSPWLV